jgi:hypothetical protein
MDNRSWTLRFTADREKLIESLRVKLRDTNRKVDTIHGVVTNASVFDEALKALEKELDEELLNQNP